MIAERAITVLRIMLINVNKFLWFDSNVIPRADAFGVISSAQQMSK